MHLSTSAEYVLSKLEAAGYGAWAVGGCVRDSLMGGEPSDWDVCTTALPAETESVFRECRVLLTGEKHGTVTVMMDKPIEVTTFRRESGYSDRRRPDCVEFTTELEQDLARRDFTINAMAWSRNGELCDPFGGRADILNGLIRCVGDPERRFSEDALRMLRALRFSSRLGFEIEGKTGSAMRRCAAYMSEVSGERILSELRGILAGSGVKDVLMGYPEVVCAALPELAPMLGFCQNNPNHIYDVWEHSVRAVAAAEPDVTVRLALLLHDMAKPSMYFVGPDGNGHFKGHCGRGAEMAGKLLRRLGCGNAETETIVRLIAVHDDPLPQDMPSMRRLMAKLGPQRMAAYFAIRKADASERAALSAARRLEQVETARRLWLKTEAEVPCLSVKELAVGGGELEAIGMRPGPEMGRLLEKLLDEVTDGKIKNTPEALVKRARELI